MLIILNYTIENVSEHWDDPNYRIFTYTMNESKKLVATSSNDTNANLYGWTQNYLGKTLYEIMEKEHADRWHVRFADWKKSGTVTYIAYFNDQSVAWETRIEIYNDTIFGIGKKINDQKLDSLTFDNYEFFNHFYIQQDQFIYLNLLAHEDSFTIESIDCNLDVDLSYYLGKDISNVTFLCSNILDKKVYQKCIETKRAIHYVEQLLISDKIYFFDIQLFPYQSPYRIFVCMKSISEDLYRKTQKHISNIYGIYPDSDYFGVCEINYENPENPYVIGCNDYFKRIIKYSDIKLSYLINNPAFQNTLSTLSTTTGELIIDYPTKEKVEYKITVTHLSEIGPNIYMVVLSQLIREQEIVNLLSGLSKREQEILTLVTDGLTNRYIANYLNISEGTVKKTIYNAYKKLGISTRVELLKLLYKQ